MTTSILGFHLTQLNAARALVASLGVLSGTVGLLGVTDPAKAAATFGVPTSSPMATPRNLYIRAAGASRLASGISLLVLLYFGENRAAALSMLCGILVGPIDSLSLKAEVEELRREAKARGKEESEKAVFDQADGKAWGHMMAGPLCVVVGGWLYYVS